jgi:sugar (pentulose or hexulose) kinase
MTHTTDALFIGVDAGTTRIKASLYDQDMKEVAAADRAITVHTPGQGWAEIDMDGLWDSLCDILRELRSANSARWPAVKGVGISGQGDGLWPVNARGEAARRAIIWNDTRTKGMRVADTPGLESLLKAECANNIYTGSMPALQMWLKANERGVYDSVRASLRCKDWLNYKLTGIIASDYSDICCSSGMNIKTLAYIPRLYELLRLEDALTTMPEGAEAASIMGQVSARAAGECGLPVGTPVLAGCIDCCAVAAGTDFFNAGDACTIVGTALINEVCITYEQIDAGDLRGLLLPHVARGSYIKMMATANGTSNMDYMKNLLCPDESLRSLDAAIEAGPIGSNGLLFHPYLFGERAPFANPFAFSSIFGLRSDHTRHDIMRAAWEGLAMSFYDCYQGVDVAQMYLSGGASASPMVCRLLCDVIGVPVKRQTAGELGALGIVKMLLVALGYASSFASLRCSSFTLYEPDMRRHKQYRALYERFTGYRDSVSRHWAGVPPVAVGPEGVCNGGGGGTNVTRALRGGPLAAAPPCGGAVVAEADALGTDARTGAL